MKTVKRARNYDADADASSFDTIVESSSSVVVASATGASSSGVSRVIGPGLDASSTAGRIDGASGRPAKKDKIKIFNDLVHTHIKVEGLCLEIVNTPQVGLHTISATVDYSIISDTNLSFTTLFFAAVPTHARPETTRRV